MGNLAWTRQKHWTYPLSALRYHAVVLGASGSGKTETLLRLAYGARKIHQMQIIYLDAKGESKRDEEESTDNAARFVATMRAAGAQNIGVFPSFHYYGWLGSPTELKNRLLSTVDYSESPYYGDVAAHVLDLAFNTPTTPRSSSHFLANLRLDRLKAIYKDDPDSYRQVLALDKDLLQQVEMRYRTFFRALDGQLDGTLDYTTQDAVYLRVRGFVLRNEAPRLGRFLIADMMHYLAERRQPGTLTLVIIDEFNALRMREETSVLFEQARSFGGCLVISAQGYAGLGPQEYADRILDACSTYIVHACSDPFHIIKRAGKYPTLDTTWSEATDDERAPRRQIRPGLAWRVPEQRVMQQDIGQAYWIYRGQAQQVHTAQVPISAEEIQEAWQEIRRQEQLQDAILQAEARRQAEKRAQQQPRNEETDPDNRREPPAQPVAPQGSRKKTNGAGKKKSTTARAQKTAPAQPVQPSPPPPPVSISIPVPDPDDDEPDRL